jgi:hypothetical protein
VGSACRLGLDHEEKKLTILIRWPGARLDGARTHFATSTGGGLHPRSSFAPLDDTAAVTITANHAALVVLRIGDAPGMVSVALANDGFWRHYTRPRTL